MANVSALSEWKKKYGHYAAQNNSPKQTGGTSMTTKASQTKSGKKASDFYADYKSREAEKAVASKPIVGLNAATPTEVIERVSGVKTEKETLPPYKPLGDKISAANPKYIQESKTYKPTKAGKLMEETKTTPDWWAREAEKALSSSRGDWLDYGAIPEASKILSESSKYKDSALLKAVKEAEQSWAVQPGRAAGANILAGIAGVADSAAGVLDMFGADKVPLLRDVTSAVHSGASQARTFAAKYNDGSYGQNLGEITQVLTAMVPYVVLSYATGGANLAVTGTKALTASKTAQTIIPILKNPSFWYSTITSMGDKYNQEISNGSGRLMATYNALLTGPTMGLIEQGGGIGATDQSRKSIWRVMVDEIFEEILQNRSSAIIDKGTTRKDMPWFSMDVGERAVFNPAEDVKTAAITAPVTAIAGGATRIGDVISGVPLNAARVRAEDADRQALDAIDSSYEGMKQNGLFSQRNQAGDSIRQATEAERRYAGKAIKAGALDADSYRNGRVTFGRDGEAEPVRVGRATKIYQPYQGNVPTQVKAERGRQVIPEQFVKTAQETITAATNTETKEVSRSWVRRSFEQIFDAQGGQKQVAVQGVTMDGEPYVVSVGKRAVRKVVSDPHLSAEKLAVLEDIEKVIANGEYVGSGEYNQKGKKEKDTVRYDYFETPVSINGTDYVVTFDVEVFPNTNNYRTHKVINEMDLTPISVTDDAPVASAAEMALSPSINSISQKAENSNNNILGDGESFEKGQALSQFATGEGYGIAQSNGPSWTPVPTMDAEVMAAERRSKLGSAKAVADILSSAYGVKFSEYSARDGLNGYYDPETRTIYINQQSSEPVLATISHELIHDLKVNDPGAFNLLRQWVKNDMNQNRFSQYRAELLAAYDAIGKDYSGMTQEQLYEYVLEEAMADLCSEVMRDPNTITRIAKADRNLAQRIMDKLNEILETIRKAFSEYFGGETAEVRELVKDFAEVKSVYQSVLENSAKRGSQSVGVPGGEVKLSYGGKHAAGMNQGMLSKAKRMRRQGATKEQIFQETNWFVGLDGKWRFEIDDREMEFNFEEPLKQRMEEMVERLRQTEPQYSEAEAYAYILKNEQPVFRLGDLVKHPKLFSQYPDLADIQLTFSQDLRKNGSYNPELNMITISTKAVYPKKTLIHELQHAIQHREGFTKGSNLDVWDGTDEEKIEKYYYTAGEIEAREASERIPMEEEERRQNMPMRNAPGAYFAEDAPGYRQAQAGTALSAEETLDSGNDSVVEYNQQNLSESGEVNVGKDTEALGAGRTSGNDDSVWQQSDGSETAYRRMGGSAGDSRTSLERGRGLIDWSGRIQSYDLSSPREKKRAYGLLREISERQIGNTDAEGRMLQEDVRDYFSNTVLKNEKGELIPLFHATDGEFTIFEKGDFGFHVGSSEQAITRGGRFIKEVYVNLKNPLIIPEDRGIWPALVVADEALRQGVITRGDYNSISKMKGFYEKRYDSPANASLRRLLKWKGYDGIVYPNKHEGEGVSAMAFDPEQIKYVSNQAPTKNSDLRFSVSRKQRATDAIAKYKETGDVRDLPERAWAKGFRRDTENRSRYLANQMQDLEYQLEYADEESRERIKGAISTLRDKIKAASENAGIAVELNDVLDNATLNRNVDLAPVIDEIVSKDKQFSIHNNVWKYGSHIFTDFYRNMENTFGKHFHLVKPLVDGIDSAAGDKARLESEKTVDVRQYVIKELGIKPGSKESAAVQWIGEKVRYPKTPEEIEARERYIRKGLEEGTIKRSEVKSIRENFVVEYSPEVLYQEFDKKTADNIIQAAEWFREQYDWFLDEINKSLRVRYGNNPEKLIPRRKDYMRHWQELSEGFAGLRNIIRQDNNISPELVRISEHTTPKRKFASFYLARTGHKTKEDAVGGFLEYLPQSARAIHLDSYIDQVRSLARDISELKQAAGSTDANSFVVYLENFAKNLAGKSDPLDRALINHFGSDGRTIVKSLNVINNWFKSSAVLLNLATSAKQLSNLPNGVALLQNPARIFAGIFDMFTLFDKKCRKQMVANYKKSNFLTERYLDKSYSKITAGPVKKAENALLGFLDEVSTRAIWNAAYREGVILHKAGEIAETPERYADVLTRRAVAGRGVAEVPLVYQMQLGKAALPFQIEPNNQWNVYRDIVNGKADSWNMSPAAERSLRLLILFSGQALLGAATTALLGASGAFNPIGDIIKGIMQGRKEEEEGTTWDKIVKMGQRSTQNVAGDLIGNRSLGWIVGEVLSLTDEDWATTYFNDSVYQSQGVNIPAIQSFFKAVKNGLDVWGSNGGELSDLPSGVARFGIDIASGVFPHGGKQIDKTVRGVADFIHGGKYQNDIYKEWLTGERGDKRYDIPKTAGNFAKSFLFGPSALSEGQDYWDNKKLEGYAQTETANANTRAMKQFAKDYNKAHPDSEVEALYREVKDFSVYPFSPIKENQDFDRDNKKHTLRLLPAELEKYQTEQNRRMQENYEAVFKTDAYRKANAERKMELLEDARREAETTVRQMIQNDYLYKDNKAYGRFLTEGEHIKRTYKDATNYSGWSEYSRTSCLLSYAKAAERDGVITSAGAKALQEALGRKQTWTALDEELYRITSEGLETQLMYNAYNVFSFTKNKQEYRINVPAGDLAKVFSDMETQFRSKLNQTIGTASYQNASLKEKQDMITDAKFDVRKVIREELKKKYGYSLDDDFAKIVRMK